jgi:tetratricopeptide (TPR) repeat protein
MLFIQYINNKHQVNYPNIHFNKFWLFLQVFIAVLMLSSCSVKPDGNTKNSGMQDFKNGGEEKIGISDLGSNNEANKLKKKTGIIEDNSIVSERNIYLEQEAQLMSSVPKDVIETFEQAVVLMQKQQWQSALTLFDEVVIKQENLSGSYVNQSLIWKKLSEQELNEEEQKSQYIKSESLIDKAISINPLNPYAHYYKGQFLQLRGEFSQAEERYAVALSIWPAFIQAQLSMAVLLELYQGKLIEAYKYYSAYLLNQGEDIQVERWQAALAIKIKRAGISMPTQ